MAVSIAKATGYTIGKKVADRYAAAEAGPLPDPRRREITAGLVDISEGMADLARGREATARAVCARVWQLQDLRPSLAVQEAARELRTANEALAAKPANSAALSIGVYPLRAELAGQALRRFQAALLPQSGE